MIGALDVKWVNLSDKDVMPKGARSYIISSCFERSININTKKV